MPTASKPPLHPVTVRWCLKRDVPGILKAQHAGFPAAPWSEADLLTLLRRRTTIGIVAEYAERVAGYALYAVADDHLEVESLAVLPAYRRRGVGRELVGRLVRKVREHHRDYVTATVPEGDLGTLLWLRACGFRAVAMAPGWFGGEDGVLMQWWR